MNINNNKQNLKIQETYETIINILVNSNLQVGTLYFMLKDILRDIEDAYNMGVEEELNALQKEQLEQEQDIEEVEAELVETE